MRNTFVFYRSFYEAIKDLPRDIQGEIYTAIMEYSLYGNETENLKPIARSIFVLIKPQLDASYQRYINGSKGGRPKNEEPNDNQEKTKQEPNDNDNVNDNDFKKENLLKEKNPDFEKFEIWIKENADFCSNSKNMKQLTEYEFLKKKKKYSGKQIADTILQIENRKDLRKKYSNIYRTLLNWLKTNYDEN
jgi:hypothetical protein